jgi:hypothetical protein
MHNAVDFWVCFLVEFLFVFLLVSSVLLFKVAVKRKFDKNILKTKMKLSGKPQLILNSQPNISQNNSNNSD